MSERSRKVTNFLWKWWNLTNKWNKYFSFLPLKKRLASSGRQVCFSFRRYWRFFKAEPQRREYLFSYTEETRGNGKLSTLSGHYAPSRSIFSTRGPKTRDSLSAWSERASEQGSTERFIGSERRKNVEEVVTLAENCDCPVKLRVLYSLYFLRTVSSSLLPPSLVWFPSSPLLLLFFSLFSSHVGIYARHHCLITMLGLHVAEGVHLVGRMRGEEETCSSDSHAPGRQHHWFKANSPRLNYRRPRS